jgi:uncharacterized membrane protein
MPSDDFKVQEQHLEQVLGNLLRAGVLLAAAVVLLGGVLFLVRHGNTPAQSRTFHSEPADLRSPSGIVADALVLQSRGIIQLGILLLIATPVARVVFSAYSFARQRDWVYVAITLLVLGVLLASLFGAYSGL